VDVADHVVDGGGGDADAGTPVWIGSG